MNFRRKQIIAIFIIMIIVGFLAYISSIKANESIIKNPNEQLLSQILDIHEILKISTFKDSLNVKKIPKTISYNKEYKVNYIGLNIILSDFNEENFCGKTFSYKYNNKINNISFRCKDNKANIQVNGMTFEKIEER